MLQVFVGTDTKKVRAALKESLLKVSVQRMLIVTPEDVYERNIDMEENQVDMFGSQPALIFDNLYSRDDTGRDPAAFAQLVTDRLVERIQSTLYYFVIEDALHAATVKKFEKEGVKVQRFDVASVIKEMPSFALTDALAARDRRMLWMYVALELAKGVAPEEVHGRLWWQMKNMLLAAQCSTAQEVGMKEFPFSKARAAARAYGEALQPTAQILADLLPQARMKGVDTRVALELFCLTL
jgi:hypothetical protein